jgi:hypothetical protein
MVTNILVAGATGNVRREVMRLDNNEECYAD